MRVQAKRLQRNGVLKVKHTVKSSGKEQRDLLIAEAGAEGMKPVYCIYCTEPQRSVWTQDKAPPGFGSLQTGCLLADAAHVPGTTTKLGAIEDKCKPWHHLFARAVVMREESRQPPPRSAAGPASVCPLSAVRHGRLDSGRLVRISSGVGE